MSMFSYDQQVELCPVCTCHITTLFVIITQNLTRPFSFWIQLRSVRAENGRRQQVLLFSGSWVQTIGLFYFIYISINQNSWRKKCRLSLYFSKCSFWGDMWYRCALEKTSGSNFVSTHYCFHDDEVNAWHKQACALKLMLILSDYV